MYITKIYADGFKNLKKIDITPHEEINIFWGKNAQGKTNLIEAVWLCTGVRSFRSTKDKGMIDINADAMTIEVSFKDSFRDQTVRYCMDKNNIKEKELFLNGIRVKNPAKLFGQLDCVVFTPEDLEISKGSPDNRRQFLDLCVSQIKNNYSNTCAKYERIIEHRNALLKNIALGKSSRDELDGWDVQLAQLGSYISLLRYNYTKILANYASKLYSEISQGKEKLEISYYSTVFSKLEGRKDFAGDLAREYLQIIKNNTDEDIRAGFTMKGVHRDDIIAKINGLVCRDFASQGQHRSCALILKLAQAYILKQETDDAPVILLDDVLSELDEFRQKFVLSKIDGMQVFITCCDKNIQFEKNKHGRLYNIEGGRIKTHKRKEKKD